MNIEILPARVNFIFPYGMKNAMPNKVNKVKQRSEAKGNKVPVLLVAHSCGINEQRKFHASFAVFGSWFEVLLVFVLPSHEA